MADEIKAREAAAALEAVAGILEREGAAEATGPLRALVLQMATYGHHPDDPVREALARLGDKWSTLLLLILRAGTFRHATLRRLVEALASERAISQRMLTLRLRSLERDGLIERTVFEAKSLRVEYRLTALGRGFSDQVKALIGWVNAHDREFRAAWAKFQKGQT